MLQKSFSLRGIFALLLTLCVGIFSVLLLGGCATHVPMALQEADIATKEFKEPTNGNAGVYVYRNEFIGAAIKMNVFVDDKFIGQTAAHTYHYVEIAPGRHIFKGSSENDSIISVEVAANKLYYIWQEVKMGVMYARNKLQLVDKTTGQKGVIGSKLAISSPISQ
ncbi:MAG: DUF2846 domain-containing protein [Campylobacteraceae bacterium]|jgi:hypothetical protein|nr:DUF2846 domain-containing protein [Campylobacteraceae bacterium]